MTCFNTVYPRTAVSVLNQKGHLQGRTGTAFQNPYGEIIFACPEVIISQSLTDMPY
jgi:hypothetical protein